MKNEEKLTSIYQLYYSCEDYDRTFGYFTTLEKAHSAKNRIVSECKEDNMKEYWYKNIFVVEHRLNIVIKNIDE